MEQGNKYVYFINARYSFNTLHVRTENASQNIYHIPYQDLYVHDAVPVDGTPRNRIYHTF